MCPESPSGESFSLAHALITNVAAQKSYSPRSSERSEVLMGFPGISEAERWMDLDQARAALNIC